MTKSCDKLLRMYKTLCVMVTWWRSTWSRRLGWSALNWKALCLIFILLTSRTLREESQSWSYPWHGSVAMPFPSMGTNIGYSASICLFLWQSTMTGGSINIHFPTHTHKHTHTCTRTPTCICVNANHFVALLLPFTLPNMVQGYMYVYLTYCKHQHNCHHMHSLHYSMHNQK